MGTPARTASGRSPLAGLVTSSRASVLRDEVAVVTPHEVTPLGDSLDGAVGIVQLASSTLVFVRYGGDVIVESPPTQRRVVATVPLGPMHVTMGTSEPGELKESGFLLSAHERTLMRPDPWAGALVVAADEQRVSEYRRMVFGDESDSPRRTAATPMLTHACRRAWSATSAITDETPQEVVDQFLGTVEDHLLTALVLSWNDDVTAGHSYGPRHVAALREWLAVNHGPGVTVTAMAGGVGLSVRQLQWVVRQRLGMTPIELLREVRLDRARDLLVAAQPDSVTVAHVAHVCGFVHLGRFSMQYRHRFGESPSSSLRAVKMSA